MYHIKDDKRSHKSCERIYNSLKELMASEDFDHISVTSIVEKAEVGRATFYRNFDHMEDVLSYKLDVKFENLYVYLKDYYKKDQLDFLSFFITPFLKYWYEDSEIIELLIKSNKLRLLSDAFEKLLKRGIKEKSTIVKEDNVFNDNINYFIAMRSGIAINVLIEWIKNKKSLEPEKVIEILFNQIKSSINQDMFK